MPTIAQAEPSITTIHIFSCTAGHRYLWTLPNRSSNTTEPLIVVDDAIVSGNKYNIGWSMEDVVAVAVLGSWIIYTIRYLDSLNPHLVL